MTFQSPEGLGSHKARMHQHRCRTRMFVSGSRCPACGVDFGSRMRARFHLKSGARRCREAFLNDMLTPLSPEAQAAADKQEAEEVRVARSLGPDLGAPPPPNTKPEDVRQNGVFEEAEEPSV